MPVVKLPAANKTFGFDIGLTGEEWDLIQEILGRLPNEIEAMIFRMIFNERFSAKSSRSLLKRLYRGATDVRDIRLSAGTCPYDDEFDLVFRMAPEPEPDTASMCTSLQRAMLQSTIDVCAQGAKPLGVVNLMCFGATQRSKAAVMIRDAMRGAGRVSHGSGIPIAETLLSVYPEYDNVSVLNSFAIGLKRRAEPSEEGECAAPDPGNLLVYIGRPLQIPAQGPRDESEIEKANRLALQISLSPAYSAGMLNSLREITSQELFGALVRPASEGLAPALVELSEQCGKALNLDLERLPCSEKVAVDELILGRLSQAIMLTANDGQYRKIREICKRHGVEQAIVGSTQETLDITISKRHDIYVRIPFERLKDYRPGREYQLVEFPPMVKDAALVRNQDALKEYDVDEAEIARSKRFDIEDKQPLVQPENLSDVWVDLVTSLNLCSRGELGRGADQQMGSRWLPGVRDASVCALWHEGEPGEGTFGRPDQAIPGVAVTMNNFGLYVKQDYYLGTVLAVADGMRSLAAVGADPIGAAHCLNFGNPNNYLDLCSLAEATRALADGCRFWNIPVLADAIDLEMSEKESGRFPLPTFVTMGKIPDLRSSCPTTFDEEGDGIFLLGETRNEISCSEYSADFHKRAEAPVPEIDFDHELQVCDLVRGLVRSGLLKSAHRVGIGGIASAYAECCFNPKQLVGASLTLEQTMSDEEFREDAMLFSETPGRFIISYDMADKEELKILITQAKIAITGEGEVGGRAIALKGALKRSIRLATAYRVWAGRLNTLTVVPHGTPEAVVPLPLP